MAAKVPLEETGIRAVVFCIPAEEFIGGDGSVGGFCIAPL
jgi:hypothetical protein